MTLKETLKKFVIEKGVDYPFTPKKIEKAGYNVRAFLKELVKEIKKADDFKEKKKEKSLKDFLSACKELEKLEKEIVA